jgi:N-acetyl-1-D-myo-inositol-2-amino-2-deoxy-alpha-D-glucopyranoside deacetylase
MIHNGRVSNFIDRPSRRLLLVHAHPDDETINNGATMAGYVAQGAGVTLVTCTRGEEGEVLVPDLAHHAAAKENTLGTYREGELAAAMKELGVTDFLFLGAPERLYRDSGMMGTLQNEHSECFWKADLDEAAHRLVEVIRDRQPQVMISYDDFGGYGHPDHIKAHQIAMRAAELAADPAYGSSEPWEVSKIYWSAIPRSALHGSLTSSNFFMKIFIKVFNYVPSEWLALPFVKADDVVTTKFDGTAYLPQKLAALRAHATQLIIHGDLFKFSKRLATRVGGVEYYTRVKGEAGTPYDKDGREMDLFAGVKE